MRKCATGSGFQHWTKPPKQPSMSKDTKQNLGESPRAHSYHFLISISKRTKHLTICVRQESFEMTRLFSATLKWWHVDQEVDSFSKVPAGRTRFSGWGREWQIFTKYEKEISNDSNYPVWVWLLWSFLLAVARNLQWLISTTSEEFLHWGEPQ